MDDIFHEKMLASSGWTSDSRGGVLVGDGTRRLGSLKLKVLPPWGGKLMQLVSTWRIIPGLGYVVNNHGDRWNVP